MTDFIQITGNKKDVLKARINPDVIYNRFDLLYNETDWDLYDLKDLVVPVKIVDDHLIVGLYLVKADQGLLLEFFDFLFKKYDKKYIEIKHCYENLCDAEPYPYWHIELPKTKEDFDKTLSHRVRYNTKWYPKKMIENFGEYIITKYSAKDLNNEIMSLYLQWKHLSHNFIWDKQPMDYIQYAGITDGYVMTIGNRICAIGFICETGNNAYFENFSYDTEYKQYSPGMIVYYYIIIDMIKLHKKILYLSGGWLDYKKWYNGVLTYTFSGHFVNPKYKHHTFWWHLRHFKF